MIYRPGKSYCRNWNNVRFATFQSYNYICQKCGEYSKGNLHLHHIQPLGCGGMDIPSNRIPVCKECHKEIHNRKYKGPLLKLRRV